jgi:thioredoxin-dependent peroxiredoxin
VLRGFEMFKRTVLIILAMGLLSVTAFAQQPSPAKTHLKVGQAAPDFTLRATDGKTYTLSDLRGKKNVVLAAYVLAFGVR